MSCLLGKLVQADAKASSFSHRDRNRKAAEDGLTKTLVDAMRGAGQRVDL